MTPGILITNDTDNTKGRRVGWNKKPLQQQLGLVEQWKNTNTKWELYLKPQRTDSSQASSMIKSYNNAGS